MSAFPPPPRLLTIEQTATELNCSPRTVWRLVGLGMLTAVRILRSTRITRESVEQFIAQGGTA